MTYLVVQWHHGNPADPVDLYSELDAGRNEVRKVEVFGDGRRQFASGDGQSGETRLGEVPVPSAAELAADPEFSPRVITAAEFEAVWAAAVRTGSARPCRADRHLT